MSVYVPVIYTQAQKIYVESFFRQNGYIDFASIKRIGITEPEKYCKEHLKGADIKYLSSCCLASYFMDQIESNIEEALSAAGYCELASVVPAIVNEKDTAALAKDFSKKLQQFQTIIIADTIILNKDYIKKLLESFQSDMEAKALEDLKKPKLLVALKTNNVTIGSSSSSSQPTTSSATSASKGKAKGKKGASAQAESKIDAEETAVEVSFMNDTALEKELSKKHKDLPEQLVEALIEYLLRPLNQQYLEVLRVQLEKSTAATADSSGKASSGKNTIKDVQEKLKTMILNAKVFEKAAKTFPNEKGQDQLNKHLIKTVCSDMANELFQYVATEQMISFSEENFNADTRNKILQKLKEPLKQKFTELNQALNTKTTSEIVDMIETISSEVLELQIKKSDQKREKEILLQLRETTKASLEAETDAATVLHQTSILLYFTINNVILNAPGRFVPMILDTLKTNLTPESHKKLTDFQTKVIESLQKAKNEEQSFDAELIGEIKSIGLNAKNHLKS